MGRKDPKQSTLSFKPPGSTAATKQASMAEGGGSSTAETGGPEAVLVELRGGFWALDTRFDSLDKKMEALGARLDNQEGRLTTAEGRISDLEDGTAQSTRRLERMEKLLKAVAVKNEDLEARGR